MKKRDRIWHNGVNNLPGLDLDYDIWESKITDADEALRTYLTNCKASMCGYGSNLDLVCNVGFHDAVPIDPVYRML